jgi:hypothetical protein
MNSNQLMYHYVSKFFSNSFCLIIAYDFVMILDQIIKSVNICSSSLIFSPISPKNLRRQTDRDLSETGHLRVGSCHNLSLSLSILNSDHVSGPN